MLINIYYLLKKQFYSDAFRYFIWYLIYHLDIFLMFIEEPFYYCKKIIKPIFIFGYPRSATTSLHETLYQSSNISSIKLSDVLFKSNILKQILKFKFINNFLSKLLIKFKTNGHKISLESLMEEHLLLFNHFIYFVIPKLYVVVPKYVINKQKIVTINDIYFIKRVIQRLDNKRYIGKLLFLDGNYEILKKVFPDMINIHCKRNLKDSFKSYIILGYNLSKQQMSYDEVKFSKFIEYHFELLKQMENNLTKIKYDYVIEFNEWCNNQEKVILDCVKNINLDVNELLIYKDGKSEQLPDNLNKILDEKLNILFT